MEPAIVGEEVVGAFGEAAQQNGELKLMSKLMCCAVLVIIRHVRVEESLASIKGNMNAVLGGMGKRAWRVVIHVGGVVEVARIESVTS